MKLRWKMVCLLLVLHGALGYMVLRFLRDRPLFLFLGQIGIILSLILWFRLMSKIYQPLNHLAMGMEILENRDFSVQLKPVGQKEWDPLINIYNAMLLQLREERLKQREQHFFLTKLIEASPSGILLLNLDNKIELYNPKAKELLKLRDPMGMDIKSIPGWQALEEGTPLLLEDEQQALRLLKGSFMSQGARRYFVLIEEISQEIRRKEQESYQRIVRIINHEIGNSLGAVNSMLESFHFYAPQLDNESRKDFQDALGIAHDRNRSVLDFTSSLADLVKLPNPQRAPWKPEESLEYLLRLMKSKPEKKVDWQVQLAPGFPEISADKGQMEQVIMNVLQNAWDALNNEGFIGISSSLDPPSLTVINNGMPLPLQDGSPFELFFTTKPQGQGIGLALCREILLNHGFQFSLKSDGNNNSVFRMVFQRAKSS